MTADRVVPSHPRYHNRGVALLIVVLALLLVGGLAAALIEISRVDTMSASRFTAVDAARYAADAALEAALAALSDAPDWNLVLAGVAPSDISGALRFDDGSAVDLASLTLDVQRATDERYSGGANRPRWTPYAHIALSALLPDPTARTPHYLVVWVGDDDEDGDGDPLRDSNGVIVLHAESRTASGG